MLDRSAPPAGVWEIDPRRSHAGFAVRRRGMATLRARFRAVSGHLDIADHLPASTLELSAVTSSVDSGSADCDQRLRSPEHLDVARHPTAAFRSTSAGWAGGRVRFHGRLTIVGVRNDVDLDVDYRGPVVDPSGARRGAFSGTGSIDREAWGLTWNVTLAPGRPLVDRTVAIDLVLEAVCQPGSASAASTSASGRR